MPPFNKEVAERLGALISLPKPMRFEMAQKGKTVEVRERVVLDFWIDGYRFSDEFMVLDDFSDPLIIGASTMRKWRLKLDLEREEVVIDPSSPG